MSRWNFLRTGRYTQETSENGVKYATKKAELSTTVLTCLKTAGKHY